MTNILAFRQFSEGSSEPQLLHSPFYPAEVYDSDGLRAEARSSHGWADLRVWRISPLGVEFVTEERSAEFISKLELGSALSLGITLGGQRCSFDGLVVATKFIEEDRTIFGVRWFQHYKSDSEIPNRRASRRWICGEQFLPTGIAASPVRFNDFIHFRVRDISRDGLQLQTSLRNKFVIPGMELDSLVSFPTIGQAKIQFKINNTRVFSQNGRDYLAIGAQARNSHPAVLELIGQYMLQFGNDTTVSELRESGFLVRALSSALEFGFVKSMSDYREVLELRKLAYVQAGKLNAEIPTEQAGDIFDTRSRILTAKYRGRLVGSLRLMFHDPDDRMEHEQFLELPITFPRKDEIVEVTRICTDPEYRGSDLFLALMKQMVIAVAQSKRRFILGSATQGLMGLYEKIGFKRCGLSFSHRDIGGQQHHLLLGDVFGISTGDGVNPLLWRELYSDVYKFIEDRVDFEFDPLMKVRVNCYAALGMFTRALTRYVREPRRARLPK